MLKTPLRCADIVQFERGGSKERGPGGPRRPEGGVWLEIVDLFATGWGRQEGRPKRGRQGGAICGEPSWRPIRRDVWPPSREQASRARAGASGFGRIFFGPLGVSLRSGRRVRSNLGASGAVRCEGAEASGFVAGGPPERVNVGSLRPPGPSQAVARPTISVSRCPWRAGAQLAAGPSHATACRPPSAQPAPLACAAAARHADAPPPRRLGGAQGRRR